MKLRSYEYCACIGFSNNKAIVNKAAARQYKSYDVAKFLQKGLFKQAFSLAYFHDSQEQMEQVLKELQSKFQEVGLPDRNIPNSVVDLVKLFGNIPATQNLNGILYV